MEANSNFEDTLQNFVSEYKQFTEQQRDRVWDALLSVSDNIDFRRRLCVRIHQSTLVKVDILGKLPEELICIILQELPVKFILNCRLVCKHWEKKITQSAIWSTLCKKASFKLPRGLTPLQYRNAFIYLRDRIVNIYNHVEITVVNTDPQMSNDVCAINYNAKKLVIGTVDGFISMLDGITLTSLFTIRTSYQPRLLKLGKEFIYALGPLREEQEDEAGTENVIYVHSCRDGCVIQRLPLDYSWFDVISLDCDEHLGIFVVGSERLVEIWRPLGGEKLLNIDVQNSKICEGALLAVHKAKDGEYIRFYYVVLSFDDGSIDACAIDANTHNILKRETIYNSRPSGGSELGLIAYSAPSGELLIRALYPVSTNTEQHCIVTMTLATRMLDAGICKGHTCATLYTCPDQDIKYSIHQDGDLVDFTGTGSVYHLVNLRATETLGHLCVFCTHKTNNPLDPLFNRNASREAVQGAIFKVGKMEYSHNSSLWATGDADWLEGIGDGADAGPIMFYIEDDTLQVIKWKPSALARIITG